jgi:hypothetical protein
MPNKHGKRIGLCFAFDNKRGYWFFYRKGFCGFGKRLKDRIVDWRDAIFWRTAA